MVRLNQWLEVVVGVQESGPKTQCLGALVQACVQNEWARVHALSVEVSNLKVWNQVFDFRSIRLAQCRDAGTAGRLSDFRALTRTVFGHCNSLHFQSRASTFRKVLIHVPENQVDPRKYYETFLQPVEDYD